ncbi:hypothetical protein CROQUDRAFT_656337 [Cronartium quercuum f. sp. fusiforme G11]|uniref:Citrate transporter-like domain-containing protein n=1 Tax=Cronartium quercuum f. sp. fusiforme G11 TaxID=708437 RepID=A0A9P6NN71_9BASI|nr:hypothetical protein CROQUDRAFT_656337 [Cronartium quercuum f. sp. fusiforme G11]
MVLAQPSRAIDGFSIFGLVVFVASIIPVLWPIKIRFGNRLSRHLRQLAIRSRVLDRPLVHDRSDVNGSDPVQLYPSWYLPLDLTLSPPLGVLVLLCTTTIDGSVIRTGVLGDGDSKPYDVLVLFICLAYLATALDSTGALRSLAVYVSNQSNGSGPQLYLILYCFFFISGIIFGNDPIILSGTAFLAYFLKNCGITDPTAWIFMEFVSSNIASAVLVSSNPTNVLIAQAFKLNFLTGFTKYTILPSLASAVIGFIILYSIFRILSRSVPDSHLPSSPNHQVQFDSSPQTLWGWIWKPWKLIPRANYIPDRLNVPRTDPRSVLTDSRGAVFHASLMVVTLILLVGTSFLKGVAVWEVALPAGVLALGRDLLVDGFSSRDRSGAIRKPDNEHAPSCTSGLELEAIGTQKKAQSTPNEITDRPRTSSDTVGETNLNDLQLDTLGSATKALSATGETTAGRQASSENDRVSGPSNSHRPCSNVEQTRSLSSSRWTIESCIRVISKRLPRTSKTVYALPLPLLPFALSIFILVRSLVYLGWVRVWAKALGSLCSGPVWTSYVIGFVGSLVLCPFAGTNIGATILMVEIIRDDGFKFHPQIANEPKTLRAAIFTTAMASNVGAFSFTLPSSLAGLLWHQILSQKAIVVRRRSFLGWNLIPVLVLSFVAYSVVAIEVMYLF